MGVASGTPLDDPAWRDSTSPSGALPEGSRSSASTACPATAAGFVGSPAASPTSAWSPSTCAVHLVRGPDGRWRWRYSATAAIVAWSELATAAPPWPGCPTLVVLGEQSWIPNRVPRMAHLTSVPVPGGHVVLWDDFDETAEAVARFLGST